jgi:hypothetical protein
MAGETVEARFRVDEEDGWHICVLRGWRTASVASRSWLDGDLDPWTFCQVYAPPQWFLDKPEPGEGYRLLGKFPDEALQPGDEAFGIDGRWSTSYQVKSFGVQVEEVWYRRRIEQPKPEPKFAVGQRVRIIGGVCSQHVGLTATITDAANNDLAWSYFVKGGVGGWFREDCLEPVVEPEPKHYVLEVGDTAKTPGHPMCRCYVDPAILKPAQAKPNVLYPKIGDVIFLPEVGRLRVTARGFEIC